VYVWFIPLVNDHELPVPHKIGLIFFKNKNKEGKKNWRRRLVKKEYRHISRDQKKKKLKLPYLDHSFWHGVSTKKKKKKSYFALSASSWLMVHSHSMLNQC
jgi:hypothetical protein